MPWRWGGKEDDREVPRRDTWEVKERTWVRAMSTEEEVD